MGTLEALPHHHLEKVDKSQGEQPSPSPEQDERRKAESTGG